MKLTDLQCRTLPTGKYADGLGLILIVRPSGRRQFSVRVQVNGADIVRKLGEYPEISLTMARAMAAQAYRDHTAGRQYGEAVRPRPAPPAVVLEAPAADVPATELDNLTFGQWCDRWVLAHKTESQWTDDYARQTEGRIKRFLKPSALWHERLRTIEKPDVAVLLDSIHFGKHPLLKGRPQRDSAVKLGGIIGGVFRFAIGKGVKGVTDPMGVVVVGSGKKIKTKNLAAILDLNVLGEILRRVHNAQFITQPVRSAITLLAYTAQRPGMVAAAKWAHFHLDGPDPVWIIPREEMKVDDDDDAPREDHTVPLAPEVVAILKAMPRDPDAVYLFTGSQGREHLGQDAMPKTFRTALGLRGKMVPHGWRSAFSTWAHGQHTDDGAEVFPYYVVELCLDHETRNDVQLAYHRGRPLGAMRKVMHAWAKELNRAQRGEHVEVPRHIEARHADTLATAQDAPAARPRGRPKKQAAT